MKFNKKFLFLMGSVLSPVVAISCGFVNTVQMSPGEKEKVPGGGVKKELTPQQIKENEVNNFLNQYKVKDLYYKGEVNNNNPFLKDWDYWFAKPSYVLKSYDISDVQNWKAHISHPYMNLNDYNAILKAYDAKIQSDSLYQNKKARFEKWAKEEFNFHPADANLKGTALNIDVSEKNYNGDLYQLINDVVNDKINIDEQTKEKFYNEVLAYLNSASDKNTY
ncbi:hypothetical protein, partial [Mycoplasma sp. 4423]